MHSAISRQDTEVHAVQANRGMVAGLDPGSCPQHPVDDALLRSPFAGLDLSLAPRIAQVAAAMPLVSRRYTQVCQRHSNMKVPENVELINRRWLCQEIKPGERAIHLFALDDEDEADDSGGDSQVAGVRNDKPGAP